MIVPHTSGIFAPAPGTLTCWQVHKALQDIDFNLSGKDKAISVDLISEQLHVNADELLGAMNVLIDLQYIRFSNKSKEKVSLTDNGRYTVIP